MRDIVQTLGGPAARPAAAPAFIVRSAGAGDGSTGDAARLATYQELRRAAFVDALGLFRGDDVDVHDGDFDTHVLVAVDGRGEVLGGVRVHPEEGFGRLGWWRGSRLVVDPAVGPLRGRIGAGLVGAACALALDLGALRFDAHVQLEHRSFFARLGWEEAGDLVVAATPHVLMRWPIRRFAELAAATKNPLGPLLSGVLPQDRWLGDDGTPVPGSATVTCVDAITPSMVERDPEWAGWCGMLVTAHDLAAMGAAPVGALDALGAADVSHAERVLAGLRAGAAALDLPILGGHTQLGVPAALAVTGLGHAGRPIPSGGASAGDVLTLTADLRGGWRRGYRGRQWDSTSGLGREELAPMMSAVRRAGPKAAKDVSMAGIVGTAGMLAEAGGHGVELEVAAVPRPEDATLGDWLTCFPGFAMLTADRPGAAPLDAGAAVGAPVGTITAEPGVRLRWPDGEVTDALLGDAVTGFGAARRADDDGASRRRAGARDGVSGLGAAAR